MSSETTGEQQPPERPDAPTDTDDETGRERGLATITMTPGDRRTDSTTLLRIEAELVCEEGKELDNPAKPRTESVGQDFLDAIEDTDLVPAWTRPWEEQHD